MLEKRKRIQDKKLIEEIKKQRCLSCGQYDVDAHHVTSVGARGGDTIDNLMPLCRKHHSQYHSMGPVFMYDTYPMIRGWFKKYGRDEEIQTARSKLSKMPGSAAKSNSQKTANGIPVNVYLLRKHGHLGADS